MTAAELAHRLNAKKSGRQWVCRCVAHEDRDPSMLIFDGRDEVQVRCMAGCTPGEIISVLKDRGLWGDDDHNLGNTRPNTRPNARPPIKPAHLEPDRANLARWLWSTRRPIQGTIAEAYLQRRGITWALPPTLGFLPARGDHPCAMISAFGVAVETEPGMLVLPDRNVTAVHLTKLTPAGAKLEKIMVGSPRGAPIMLSTFNDLLGLVITEGIEEGLSVLDITGMGIWAAGAATLMPSLALAVPEWVGSVTVIADVADANGAGLRHASHLVDVLLKRGIPAVAIPSRGGSFA